MSKIRCSRCGYDLREHELHERCSECGADVTLAYTDHPLFSGDLQLALRKGLRWIAASLAILPLVIPPISVIYSGNMTRFPLPFPAWIPLAALQQIFWLRGIILVTRCSHHALARTRVLVRGAACLMSVALILLIILPGIEFSPLTGHFWRAVLAAGGLLMLSLAIGLLATWFARLSKWMDTPSFTWQLHSVAVLLLLPIAASAAVTITVALSRTDWIDGLYYGMIVAIFGSLSTGSLGTAWLLLTCLLWGRELHKENVALGLAK